MAMRPWGSLIGRILAALQWTGWVSLLMRAQDLFRFKLQERSSVRLVARRFLAEYRAC